LCRRYVDFDMARWPPGQHRGCARRCLRSGLTASLAQTAVKCGYFDQAHLTDDWKRLGGCTPGEWISEELPFLQDRESGRGAC
jgi:AraC-like DNA-binding protein